MAAFLPLVALLLGLGGPVAATHLAHSSVALRVTVSAFAQQHAGAVLKHRSDARSHTHVAFAAKCVVPRHRLCTFVAFACCVGCGSLGDLVGFVTSHEAAARVDTCDASLAPGLALELDAGWRVRHLSPGYCETALAPPLPPSHSPHSPHPTPHTPHPPGCIFGSCSCCAKLSSLTDVGLGRGFSGFGVYGCG
jgi:hypothetical protein